MFRIINIARQRAATLYRNIARAHAPRQELEVFETRVGVKYRFGRFDSNLFNNYVLQRIPFSYTNLSFADLLMPPDLLRDIHTLCGRSILESPHYEMVAQVLIGNLNVDSEYVRRSKIGTLDNRLPREIVLPDLISTCKQRYAELRSDKMMNIFVVKLALNGNPSYMIADGKHRAALAAYCGRPESILMQIMSPEFVKTSFFRQIYSYTLSRDSSEYSANQEMIRSLQYE